MHENNPAWQFFAALQRGPDPKSVERSIARDEALDAILTDVLTDPMPQKDLVSRRFFSLCRNRLSKHVHRRAIDSRRFRGTQRRCGVDFGNRLLVSPAQNPVDRVAYRQLVALLRSVLPDDDFRLLLEIADGNSYSDIAIAHQKTASSLKAKVFRIREKVRKSQVSPILRCWPRG
jgi:hypothetical protein